MPKKVVVETKKSECFIDSITSGVAKLLFEKSDGHSYPSFMPLEFLPEGVIEGTNLKLEIAIDPEGTKRSKKAVAMLYRSLEKKEDKKEKKKKK